MHFRYLLSEHLTLHRSKSTVLHKDTMTIAHCGATTAHGSRQYTYFIGGHERQQRAR